MQPDLATKYLIGNVFSTGRTKLVIGPCDRLHLAELPPLWRLHWPPGGAKGWTSHLLDFS